MAGPREYDVVVVGAGIEGSATAYHLAKSGQKTLLLEQVSEFVQNRCFTGKVSTGRGGTYCHDPYPTNLGSVHVPQSRLVSFNRTSRPTFFLIFLWGLSTDTDPSSDENMPVQIFIRAWIRVSRKAT